MRSTYFYLSFMFLLAILNGCKKSRVNIPPTGTMRLVTTIAGGPAVRVREGSFTGNVPLNNANVNFNLYAGNPDIYVWPVGDSLNPYYNSNKSVQVNDGDMFTLFLCGVPGVSAEGIMVKETFPAITDSVAMIRFVNLSPNSTPVNVTLSTSTSVNQFSDVSYKQFSEFKSFPATAANTSYIFQVRAVNNPGIVLASVTMSGTALASFVPRFRYATIVFRGMVAGNPAPGITRVNHYPTAGF